MCDGRGFLEGGGERIKFIVMVIVEGHNAQTYHGVLGISMFLVLSSHALTWCCFCLFF